MWILLNYTICKTNEEFFIHDFLSTSVLILFTFLYTILRFSSIIIIIWVIYLILIYTCINNFWFRVIIISFLSIQVIATYTIASSSFICLANNRYFVLAWKENINHIVPSDKPRHMYYTSFNFLIRKSNITSAFEIVIFW
jgi:hypothetical protein